MIAWVEVVIPARDEVGSIGAALAAVDVAAARVAVPTRVHVVLDRCVDDTLDVIRRTPTSVPVEVVVASVATVGDVRALGVERAAIGRCPARTWIASTDADSVVGPDWLEAHLALARAGMGAVVGVVTVEDWSARPASLPDVLRHHDEVARGPAPIHGANLGVRLDAYVAAGGFPSLACGEDRALVAALRAVGTTIAYTTAAPVTTSARVRGRARGGFADTLTAWAMATDDRTSVPPPVTAAKGR